MSERITVTFTSTYEYTEEDVSNMSDEEIIEMARDAFYLDGAKVSAQIDRRNNDE